MATREERLAENEAIFREVNERVAEVSTKFGLEALSAVCECSNAGCMERFELERSAYADLRSSGDRFAVVPGHEEPDVERTVDRGEGYLIIEKVGAGAEVAERTDSSPEPAERKE